VLLDKLKPRVRTVVNKTESTGGPYRTFGMEVLAGDPSLETSLRENGCTFTLDFAKVYWNSRLETEHRRVVDSLAEGDVLADAFCGIGPFVIPASRMHKCKVYANDLNPSSVEYLKRNAAKNRIPTGAGGDFQVSCGCARDFLRRLVRDERVPITRVVMNFPSGAPEFLDVFAGLYAGLEDDEMPMPKVNCYCFARGDEWKNETTMRVRAALGLGGGDVLDVDVREVRDVAPNKLHVCATFVVPEHVAYGRTGGTPAAPDAAVGGGAASAPEAKRQRV
jgi:tRNA (guanine37-N1)-methyltransferase